MRYAVLDSEAILDLWEAELLPERQSRDEQLAPEEFRDRLTALLKDCQKECQCFESSVVTAIQGEVTACRYLELPLLSEEELRVAVPAEAGKLLAFPMEQTALSYFQVPPLSAGAGTMGIFLVAARKDSVDTMKRVLEECGLQVRRIEIPVVAMIREFVRNRALPNDDRFYLLVHAGFRFTHVAALRNGYPYFALEFSTGGRDFTYAFQVGSRRSWKEAEACKRGYDAAELDSMIEPLLTRWMDESKRALDFFRARFLKGDGVFDRVFLSGGAAGLKNLDRRLAAHLGLPVQGEERDKLRLKTAGKTTGSPVDYTIAVGLALGGE